MPAETGRRFTLRRFADIAPRNVDWLVPGLIPLRALTLVAGVGGLGKSIYLAGVAAETSRGSYLGGHPGDVIVVSYEDTAEEVWRPRLEAARADLARVHEFRFSGAGIENLELPRDLEELRRLVGEVQARLVVIDPVVAALSLSLDSHKNHHVRVVLSGLSTLAEDENCAVAMVGHVNKAPTGDAYLRVADSIAFWNASRSVVLVTEDADEPDALRLIAQRKMNWARVRPVERHLIEEVILPETLDAASGRPIATARMRFVEIADDVDGSAVLTPRKEPPKREQAETGLARLLADGDWRESGPVKTALRDAGYSGRTIERAAESLGVEAERRGFPARTSWRLPPVAPPLLHMGGATGGVTDDSGQPSCLEDAVTPAAPNVMGTATGGATARSLPEREQVIWDDLANLLDAREVGPS
jgi:hypothetical protein